MADSPFVGTWKLVSVEPGQAGGLNTPREGRITYTADGRMSVAIQPIGRASLPNASVRDASSEQLRATVDGYTSYCGRYTVYPDRVVHHVEISLVPNRVGTDLVRYYDLQDNRVTLRTPE